MTANHQLQKTLNNLLPVGYKAWVTRTWFTVVYKREKKGHSLIAALVLSPDLNRAIDQFNEYMDRRAALISCAVPSYKRPVTPEFILTNATIH